MGWSPSKIERALASKAAKPKTDDGLHAVVVDLLAGVAVRHGAVRVWVHDFRGRVETEAYLADRREVWSIADLTSRAATLEPDVLVEIVA